MSAVRAEDRPAADPVNVAALDLVGLPALMNRTEGVSSVVVGLADGPVAPDLAAFEGRRLGVAAGAEAAACAVRSSVACDHGTLVAAMLVGARASGAPGICPGCAIVVRPILPERPAAGDGVPRASLDALAAAVIDCVRSGARVINLSLSLVGAGAPGAASRMARALDFAAERRALVVAAAGNEGEIGGSAITQHPWVIPVAACDLRGRPLGLTNWGRSIGARGLAAPGEAVSVGAGGRARRFTGTSAAAAFVTGAIALSWSLAPAAPAEVIRRAIIGPDRRAALWPPLLDARAALRRLSEHRRTEEDT
jgi:subtilisin family serine protease